MTIGFYLGHDLDLAFSMSNMEFPLSRPKNDPIPTKQKASISTEHSQMWPLDLTFAVTLTLNFQGKIWNSLYPGQKWSDCHETKSKYIDCTLSLKCDHRIWPWLWPRPLIVKVKYGIHYISAKNCPIATKQKQTYRLNSKPRMRP